MILPHLEEEAAGGRACRGLSRSLQPLSVQLLLEFLESLLLRSLALQDPPTAAHLELLVLHMPLLLHMPLQPPVLHPRQSRAQRLFRRHLHLPREN